MKPQENTTPLYYILYKPFGYLSQFTDEGSRQGLSHLHDFPKDIYPVGRLDADSEGLLILTNDKHLKHHVLEPKFAHSKTYLAQVEGDVTDRAIADLTEGVTIKVNKKEYRTKEADISLIPPPISLPEREPPIRFRINVPTSWLKVVITEGKNRQVRKMTAKVGFPTLRLVRVAIENLTIGNKQAGEVWTMEKDTIYQLLKVKEATFRREDKKTFRKDDKKTFRKDDKKTFRKDDKKTYKPTKFGYKKKQGK